MWKEYMLANACACFSSRHRSASGGARLDRAVSRVSVECVPASSGLLARQDRLARHAGLCSPQHVLAKLMLSRLVRKLVSWRMLATLELLAMPATPLRLKGTRDLVCVA